MDTNIKIITSKPLEEITQVTRSDNNPRKRKKSNSQEKEDEVILQGKKKKVQITDRTDPEGKVLPGHEVDIVVK